MEKYFRFGQVLKPQGIKGELKLKTFTDDLSRVGDIDHIYLKKGDEYERRSVSGARTYKQFVYLKIDGIPDRNEAERYRNRVIYIDRESAAPLPEGAVYIADIIGARVSTDKGEELGELTDVLQNGATDVYVVKGERGCMFPAVPHVIVKRDAEAAKIVVNADELEKIAVFD